jgi:hypothetical protein
MPGFAARCHDGFLSGTIQRMFYQQAPPPS